MSGSGGGAGVGMPLPRPIEPVAPATPPRRSRSRFRRGISWALALGLAWLLVAAPPPLWYWLVNPRETAFMAMRERQGGAGEEGQARRHTPVRLEAIAPVMQRAVLIAEDNRFYEHHGFDWVQVRRALGYPRDDFDWRSPRHRADLQRAVTRSLNGGRQVRGASTITQQLAKNLYLSPSRNPLRKVKEAVLAKRLEWSLPKDRILELYLNVAEFGPGIWGVEAASQAYYRKPAARLGRAEAAALAALLPFPLLSNPTYRPARMRGRQALILQRLR